MDKTMAFNEYKESAILEDTFSTFPDTSVSCKLILTEKILYIVFLNKSKPEREEILLRDMVGSRVLKNNSRSKNESKDLCAYLSIYSYPLKSFSGILSKQLRRDRKVSTLKVSNFTTLDENLKLANKWQVAITCLIKGVTLRKNEGFYIPKTVPTARKLLILINPKSGPGKAYQVFKDRIAPILAETDIAYELLVTDRPNCGRDYVKKADLFQWDGIVVISGDGLLFEVYNGVMNRPDWKEVVKIPIGVIPGGSGNGLARTLCHASGEPYDSTSIIPFVLSIVHGKVVPMDLVKVETENKTLYSFLSVGWGLMADIDIESERLRAIGEVRFTIWGIIRALGLRKYKGRLSYLPVHGFEPNSTVTAPASEPCPKRSKTIDCPLAWSEDINISTNGGDEHNIFRSKSFGTHNPELDTEREVRLTKFSYTGEEVNSSSYNTPSLNSLINGSDLTENIPHSHCQEDLGKSTEELYETVHSNFCPPLGTPLPDNWVVIEDEFVLAFACHQTHLSTDVFFAPKAKLDDGVMWLVMIRGNASRAQVMYFLAALESGGHVNHACAHVVPVHAFRLEPYTQDGFITVDGEVIPVCDIQAEVLPSFARIMCR